ncbi:Uncharacterised protein [uncultured archaeon]|nr:Uncharacterised protein [uncultured archaeon]
MAAKKFFVYLLIILLTVYPASAESISVNRWVLNVTLHDDGLVEEVIQAEIENGGSSDLHGFSFTVPASQVTMIYDFDHTASFTGQVVELQTVSGKTKITINFNDSIPGGKKWDGRIGFTAENWAVKQGSDYSIDIPIEAPQAIVSGKGTAMSVSADADIRTQVFFPKAVEVTSINPAPFRILFQYGHMVPTYSSDKLHVGDTISIKGSYSDTLNKIVGNDDLIRSLSTSIKQAKAQGKDVSEAEAHLKNAEDYNTNQALASFWKKDNAAALEYVGYAKDELSKAEASLKGEVKETPQPTSGTEGESKKTPGFEAFVLVFITMATFHIMKKRRK